VNPKGDAWPAELSENVLVKIFKDRVVGGWSPINEMSKLHFYASNQTICLNKINFLRV